jgi:hypothetical protein
MLAITIFLSVPPNSTLYWTNLRNVVFYHIKKIRLEKKSIKHIRHYFQAFIKLILFNKLHHIIDLIHIKLLISI